MAIFNFVLQATVEKLCLKHNITTLNVQRRDEQFPVLWFVQIKPYKGEVNLPSAPRPAYLAV